MFPNPGNQKVRQFFHFTHTQKKTILHGFLQ